MRERLLKEEGGFTLPEVLVAMVMMVTVMFALYAIFDMSLRVFSFGNDKVEAVENARVGLTKMEREVRAAYPENRANGQNTLLFPGTDTDAIVFRNDLDGNRLAAADEEIRYEVDGGTLERNGQSAVENASDLNFEYQDEQGNALDPNTDLPDTEIVEISLTVDVDGRTQVLSTDVFLRNQGGAPTSSQSACSDGVDNDTDTKTDFPDDPGCSSTSDNDETDPPPSSDPECSDGDDNDSDGATDHPADPGCTDEDDDSESPDPTVNQPPTAENDTATTRNKGPAADRPVTINVLANDDDPDGDLLTVESFTSPSKGTVTLNGDGTLTYTPKNGSSGRGDFTFDYTVSDGRGGTASATVTVTVTD